MRRAAAFSCVIVGCLTVGCSTINPSAYQHRGIAEPMAGSVTRTFPASATFVAERMVDVMRQEDILENVVMYHDPANKECRSFSKGDRQALGISPLTPANDVNFDIKAKCKDGSPVVVAVRLKGDSSAEASVVYGYGGDPDLSRDLLDKVEKVLVASSKDNAVAKAAGTRKSAQR